MDLAVEGWKRRWGLGWIVRCSLGSQTPAVLLMQVTITNRNLLILLHCFLLKLRDTGVLNGSKVGGYDESPSRDRLIYLTTCLIGHHVEVQVKNGSIFSGIFHATNAERDFGTFHCL